MADQPYINKQDWGKELLERLGNLTDGNGKINTWSQLPTLGKDGQELGPSHSGLNGILVEEDYSSFVQWDGAEWKKILVVPITTATGDTQITESSVSGSGIVGFLDPGYAFDFFIASVHDAISGDTTIYSYDKDSLAINWQTNISPIGSVSDFSTIPSVCVDGSSIYLAASGRATYPDSQPRSGRVFCLDLNTGAFKWVSPNLGSEQTHGNTLTVVTLGNADEILAGQQLTIFRLSRFNGQLIAQSSATLPEYALSVHWSPSDSSIICHSSSSIYKLPLSLDSVAILSALEAGSSAIQDATTQNIFYFLSKDELVVYNSSSHSVEAAISIDLAARGLTLSPTIIAQMDTEDGIDLIFTSGESVFIYSLNKTAYSFIFKQQYQMGGNGRLCSVAPTLISAIDDKKHIQVSVAGTQGYSSGLITTYSVNSSSFVYQSNIIKGKTSVGRIAPNLALSAPSFYANAIKGGRANLDKLSVGNDREDYYQSSNGSAELQVGYSNYFGLSKWTSAESSKGYAGGGYHVQGVVFQGNLTENKIIKRSSDGYSTGIISYDTVLGKLFIETRQGGTNGTQIENFPDGSGMVVASANSVGFGTESPAYKVDVVGTLRATEVRNSAGVVTSDRRMKTGIQALDGSVLWDLFAEIAPVSFLYRPNFEAAKHEVQADEDGNETTVEIREKWNLPQGIQFGYIADEVERVLPELVTADESTGIQYLASGHIPVLFQAAATAKINAMQTEIDDLKNQNTQMQSAIASLTARVEALENA